MHFTGNPLFERKKKETKIHEMMDEDSQDKYKIENRK